MGLKPLAARLTQLFLQEFSIASWKGKSAGPEAQVCLELVAELRIATLEGRLRAVWFHVPNETNGTYKRTAEALARAQGRLSGVADYIFLWQGGCMAIEMKAGRNSISPNQERFREWCALMNVPYSVCYTASSALALLKEAKIYDSP